MMYRMLGLFLLLITTSVFAQSTTTTTTIVQKGIVTPPPKGSCTTVQGHWVDGNTWADTYTQCKYENRSEGAVYISDYWSCTQATADGTCTAWTLVPGHWQQSQ